VARPSAAAGAEARATGFSVRVCPQEGGGGLRPARVERGVAFGRQRRVGRDRLRRLEHLDLRRLRVASAEAEERFDPAAAEEAERRRAGRVGGGLGGSGREAGPTAIPAASNFMALPWASTMNRPLVDNG